MTRADRDRAHRQAVEQNKARIRGLMQNGNDHIYGEENFRAATLAKDYVEADALEELLPEIAAHNRKVGGGTKARVQDYLDRERRKGYEERQKRDHARVQQERDRYRRDHPALDLDAAQNQPHTTTVAAPAHAQLSEQEAYEQELAKFEVKRRRAQKEGWAYTLVPPTKPKQQKRQPMSPY